MNKLERLQKILKELGSCAIAFSGGVDSTLLLKVAVNTLGDKAVAVTALSSTYPRHEQEEAVELARQIGARQVLIESEELDIEGFASNLPDRCYFCKRELFSKLLHVADKEGLQYVCDGANLDDTGDHRPGLKAAREMRVRSPLLEAGLTKEDIRELSRQLGLPTWNKPAMACLSSRFPYGEKITPEKLARVEAAESYLRSLGFQQLRVRHHRGIARIEVPDKDFQRLLAARTGLAARFKELGFTYVTLDLEGFRSGSMNEVLKGAAENE